MKIEDKIGRVISLNKNNVNNHNNEDKGVGFESFLKEKLEDVNEKQIIRDKTTEALIKGEDVEIHDVMIASKEAEISLQLALEVRNKLVEAYQEFNRMQI